jgi:hypothetical protein
MKFLSLEISVVALLAFVSIGAHASRPEDLPKEDLQAGITPLASITGAAEPGVQIVVMGLGKSKIVVGVVGQADGTYRVENLPAGRYSIKVDLPNHAARTLTLEPGQVGHVDLAPSKK